MGISGKKATIPQDWSNETIEFEMKAGFREKTIRLPMLQFDLRAKGTSIWVSSITVERTKRGASPANNSRTSTPEVKFDNEKRGTRNSAGPQATNAHGSAEFVQPKYRRDGAVLCGTKQLITRPWQSYQLIIDGNWVFDVEEYFDLGAGSVAPRAFRRGVANKNGEKPMEIYSSNSYRAHIEAYDRWTGDFKKVGTYDFNMTLSNDGLVFLESSLLSDAPSVQNSGLTRMAIPLNLEVDYEYRKEGVVKKLSSFTSTTFHGEGIQDCEIVFFPNNPERKFTIVPVTISSITIDSKAISLKGFPGKIQYLLDVRGEKEIPAAERTPNGVSLWRIDQLRLPHGSEPKNLILNSSFESGFRYWGWTTTSGDGLPLVFSNVYTLDAKSAFHGKSSLRIKVLPQKNSQRLGTFGIPFQPGEKYTLSFYARASKKGALACQMSARGIKRADALLKFDGTNSFLLGTDWRRFSLSGTAKELFYSIYVDAAPVEGLLEHSAALRGEVRMPPSFVA
jgi:hypothetical protein